MNARSLIVLVLAAAACGGPRLDTRTFTLRYLGGSGAAQLLSPYVFQDRPSGKGSISFSEHAITVRETNDNLEKIARVLKDYDVPRPSVRFTFRLIEADGAAPRDSSIAEVETELRKIFRFAGYRLASEAVVTGTEGGVLNQVLTGEGGPYRMYGEIQQIAGAGDSARVELRVQLDARGGQFRTTVGLPVGKTAVLGNVLPGPSGRTVILTVRAELVN
ncbi:MAG TPA: hypothetical protein VFK78_11775 [Gemmatimonadales bacterium]|nr:hypothetical protein [Gemmatimonadales bacterium]